MKSNIAHIIELIVISILFIACANDNKKVVVCWGDSLTAPQGNESGLKGFIKKVLGKDMSYPFWLQGLLGDEYDVINAGVGGENTLTIMARQGAYPMRLAHDVTIFSSDKAKEDRVVIGNTDLPAFVSSYNGQEVRPLLQSDSEENGSAQINPCVIGGGNLS